MKVPEFLKVNRNPDPPRCHHTSDEGSPCNAPPQSGKKYCFFHDPRQQKKREAAHRNGGFMRNRRSQNEDAPLLPPNPPLVSFKTFDDVGQFFEQVTNYVLQGQMDARTANCLRQLASGRLRVFEAKARAQRQEEEANARAKADAAQSDQPRGSSGKKQPFSDLECHVTDLATGTVRIIKGGVTTVIPPPPRIPPDPPLPGDPYHHDEHASIESRAEASNARQRAFIDSIIAQERSNSNLNANSGSKPLSPPAKQGQPSALQHDPPPPLRHDPSPQNAAGPARLETTATRTMTTPTPVETTPVEATKAEPPKPAAAAALSIPAPSTPAAASPDKQAKYQHKPEPPGCPTYWRYWNQ